MITLYTTREERSVKGKTQIHHTFAISKTITVHSCEKVSRARYTCKYSVRSKINQLYRSAWEPCGVRKYYYIPFAARLSASRILNYVSKNFAANLSSRVFFLHTPSHHTPTKDNANFIVYGKHRYLKSSEKACMRTAPLQLRSRSTFDLCQKYPLKQFGIMKLNSKTFRRPCKLLSKYPAIREGFSKEISASCILYST